MTYQPLNRLDSSRLPDVVEGLTKEDVVVDSDQATKSDQQRVTRAKPTKLQEHMADITVAMLYLGCGGD